MSTQRHVYSYIYKHREKGREGGREGREEEGRKEAGAIKNGQMKITGISESRVYENSLYYSGNVSLSLKVHQNFKLPK